MPTDLASDRRLFAAVSTLTVLTCYALPDAVRSRPARAAIKVGLLGVTAAGVTQIPRVYPAAAATLPPLKPTEPKDQALAVAGTAAAIAATVWFEKVVYAYGERLRARGVRCAHTPGATLLALATGAVALVDWGRRPESGDAGEAIPT